jgi:hydroxypyruvate reductase
MTLARAEVVVTSRIPPFLMSGLQEKYVVHEREHIRDPQVLGRVKALVGGVKQKLMRAIWPCFQRYK